MRFRLAALLAILSVAAAAQHMGGGSAGFPPGGLQPGHPSPFPTPGYGARNSFWGWHNHRGNGPATFYGPYLPVVWPPCSPPVFPDPLAYWFSNAFCNPGYNQPQQPADAYPPADMMAPPPQPPPVPMPPPVPDGLAIVMPPPPRPIVVQRAETTPPACCPPAPETYPAVLAFKAGGMYSVNKYWVRNKRIYFVTTQNETLYAPLAQLARVYPGKTKPSITP